MAEKVHIQLTPEEISSMQFKIISIAKQAADMKRLNDMVIHMENCEKSLPFIDKKMAQRTKLHLLSLRLIANNIIQIKKIHDQMISEMDLKNDNKTVPES